MKLYRTFGYGGGQEKRAGSADPTRENTKQRGPLALRAGDAGSGASAGAAAPEDGAEGGRTGEERSGGRGLGDRREGEVVARAAGVGDLEGGAAERDEAALGQAGEGAGDGGAGVG